MTSKPTKPRNRLSRGGGNPRANPARQNVSGEIRNNLPKANVVRGLVPRWGRVGAWQNPPCQFAVLTYNSGFSYLGLPAQAGMSDDYENGWFLKLVLTRAGPFFITLSGLRRSKGIQASHKFPTDRSINPSRCEQLLVQLKAKTRAIGQHNGAILDSSRWV